MLDGGDLPLTRIAIGPHFGDTAEVLAYVIVPGTAGRFISQQEAVRQIRRSFMGPSAGLHEEREAFVPVFLDESQVKFGPPQISDTDQLKERITAGRKPDGLAIFEERPVSLLGYDLMAYINFSSSHAFDRFLGPCPSPQQCMEGAMPAAPRRPRLPQQGGSLSSALRRPGHG